MRAQECVQFNNINAGATDEFQLQGGVYNVHAVAAAWGGGNANVQMLGPDGATWLDHFASGIAANGIKEAAYFAPGTYRVNVTTTNSVYINIVRVPFD